MNDRNSNRGQNTRFYRDSQFGKLMGVCAGIGDYMGVNPLWIRLWAVITIFITSGIVIPLYFFIGMLANKKPPHLYYQDREQRQFWQGVRQSPARTAREVRGKFRDIDRRLADIEFHYTSSNKQLADQIDELR